MFGKRVLWMSRMLSLLTVAVLTIGSAVEAQAPQQGQRGGGAPGAGPGGGGQRGGAPAAPAIQQVKPGFYMVTGIGGNTSVRVTNEGLILVDTKNLGDQNYAALMDVIRTVSNLPVRYAFITHVHQDHSGGSAKFKEEGTQVIAHEGLLRNLETYTSNAGTPAPPSITYSREHVVQLGGAAAYAYHFAPGHTSGDTIVHFPDVRVVALGDELSIPNWNCDYAQGGSVLGWQRSFEEVAKLDFDTAIPGHGNPMTKEEFLQYKARFDTFVSRALDAVRRGVPKDQLMADIRQDDLGWNITMPEGVRLDGFYEELSRAR